ncbi:ATP-binding protein [Thermus scotoductus]|uniref:ATP-binding protein n=1 Tax=Thermus scotoductus TaxID=37636 RepID=UPI00037F4E53|nr:ATP-binding protein [Thermus scotoductus]
MFVGRKEEGRAVLLSVRAGRGVVLAAPPGYGKTALLRELLPALEAWAPVVWADRVVPFGTFLKDLCRGLRILEEALGARGSPPSSPPRRASPARTP